MTVREDPIQLKNAEEAQESPVPGDSRVEQGSSMGVNTLCILPMIMLMNLRSIVYQIDLHVRIFTSVCKIHY